MNEYSAELKNPQWQKMRLEVFQRDGFKCRACNSAEKPLHAHHTFYVKGRKPWQYLPWSIITLCEDCHANTHNEPWRSQWWEWAIMIALDTKIEAMSHQLIQHRDIKRLVSDHDEFIKMLWEHSELKSKDEIQEQIAA